MKTVPQPDFDGLVRASYRPLYNYAYRLTGKHDDAEISQATHCRIGTVRSRLHRGRTLLRGEIEICCHITDAQRSSARQGIRRRADVSSGQRTLSVVPSEGVI
jgi:hypothetical protein